MIATRLRENILWRWWDLVGREPRLDVGSSSQIETFGTGDGAWPVHTPSVARSGLCYSFGVGFDLSFDRAVIDAFDLEVHAFDPTPLSQEWVQRQPAHPKLTVHPWGIAPTDGVVSFVLPRHHGVSFTPLKYGSHKAVAECEVRTLQTIRRRLGHTDRPITLLKLDIEGGEYGVLPHIAADPLLSQVLVEFHHRLRPARIRDTMEAVRLMANAGWRLAHRSRRGLEYVFLRSDALGS
jgi:FkbM family methyltransferase